MFQQNDQDSKIFMHTLRSLEHTLRAHARNIIIILLKPILLHLMHYFIGRVSCFPLIII